MPIRAIYVPESELPSIARKGVLYVTSDTNLMYVGTGEALVPVQPLSSGLGVGMGAFVSSGTTDGGVF